MDTKDGTLGLPTPVVEGYLLPVPHRGGYLHVTDQTSKGTGNNNLDGCAYEDMTEMSLVTNDLQEVQVESVAMEEKMTYESLNQSDVDRNTSEGKVYQQLA